MISKNGSSLVANLKMLKPQTQNLLEIKLTVYLIKPGQLTFSYRKKGKQEVGYVNGQIKFFLNSKLIVLEDREQIIGGNTINYKLKQGANEFVWQFILTTEADVSSLSAELTVSILLKQ